MTGAPVAALADDASGEQPAEQTEPVQPEDPQPQPEPQPEPQPAEQPQTEPVPAAPKVSSVKQKGARLIVKWNKPSGKVSGYEVRYSLKKSMKSSKKKTVAKASMKNLVLHGLKFKKKYYVQVRSYTKSGNAKTYSSWSTAKTGKLKSKTRMELINLMGKASKTKSVKTFATDYKLSKTKAGKALLKHVRAMKKYHKISFMMVDLNTGEGITSASARMMYSASALKGPFVASLNKYMPSSRSSSGTMYYTIVPSSNEDYAALRNRYGSGTMLKLMNSSKVSSWPYYRRYCHVPTRDLAKLWVSVYWYFYKDMNKNSKWCRSLYTHGAESFIYHSMRGKKKVHTKPGWFPGGGRNSHNDAGIIMSKVGKQSRPYVLAIMTSAYGSEGDLQKLVRLIDAVHTDMVK